MMKLCFKLFEHTTYVACPSMRSSMCLIDSSSVVESTRFKAITKWGDILRGQHEIYVWLFCSQRAQTITHTNVLRRAIEAVRSTNDSIIESQIDVLNQTTLLLDCHYVGLEFLSLSRGELYESEGGFQVEWKNTLDFSNKEVDKLGILFEYLTESLLYVTNFCVLCSKYHSNVILKHQIIEHFQNIPVVLSNVVFSGRKQTDACSNCSLILSTSRGSSEIRKATYGGFRHHSRITGCLQEDT